MKKEFLIITLVIFSLFFISCSKQKVLVSDRHVYSYEIIKNEALYKKCPTLVLLDYHNDIKSDTYNLTSYNWVSKLIEEDVITKVYWISGGVLNTLNRNARMKWLGRNLTDYDLENEDKIRNAITLLDFEDLKQCDFSENVIITLDFDVLTKNPGPDDMAFIIQLCEWIQKQKSPLVTLSFSSVYQNNPQKAYDWFYKFINGYNKKSDWYFLSSKYVENAESKEEMTAWNDWKENPAVFRKYNQSFFENAFFWTQIPRNIKQELINKNIKAYKNDEISNEIIRSWKNPDLIELEKYFTEEKLNNCFALVKNQILNSKNCDCPDLQGDFTDEKSFGIAVRLFIHLENYEKDRGCLALYYGLNDSNLEAAIKYCAVEACNDPRYYPIQKDEINDLYVNISVFSKWEKMTSPYDFVPGVDAVLVINENAANENDYKTLLQPAIALERNYNKDDFLECLYNKAKITQDAYKTYDLEFYKSKTISYYSKLVNNY